MLIGFTPANPIRLPDPSLLSDLSFRTERPDAFSFRFTSREAVGRRREKSALAFDLQLSTLNRLLLALGC
jgi:hypothetical protein